jgi:hypothetical protein
LMAIIKSRTSASVFRELLRGGEDITLS